MSKLHNAPCLDPVWDRYIENSLEGMAMAKHGKGVCRRVVAEGVSLKNWQDFLHSNKTELLIQLLDQGFICDILPKHKEACNYWWWFEQASIMWPTFSLSMNTWRSRYSPIVAWKLCSILWSFQSTNQDSRHRCHCVGLLLQHHWVQTMNSG